MPIMDVFSHKVLQNANGSMDSSSCDPRCLPGLRPQKEAQVEAMCAERQPSTLPVTKSLMDPAYMHACILQLIMANQDMVMSGSFVGEIAWLWKSNPDMLQRQAEDEGMTGKGYLRNFVYAGWGGIPEFQALLGCEDCERDGRDSPRRVR